MNLCCNIMTGVIISCFVMFSPVYGSITCGLGQASVSNTVESTPSPAGNNPTFVTERKSNVYTGAAEAFDIWAPRQHNPEFAEPGEKISVELKGTANLINDEWTVKLKNDLRSWQGEEVSASWGKVHHGTENGWQVTVTLPSDIPPELMKLVVRHGSGLEAVSRRSVYIVPDFEEDFYIFHQSDQHITENYAVEPGGKASTTWGNGSKEALMWITSAVNLANPRFVLHTGDNMQIFFSADHWCGYEEAILRVNRFFDGMSGYSVPTVVTTGNHDIGYSNYLNYDKWRKQYTRQMGQRAFSFRMGSFYVLNSEWTTTDFLDWAKSDYAASYKDPDIAYRLIASHYYDGLDGWTTVAGEEDPANLMLVGHNHRTRTIQTKPYRVLSVETALNHQKAAFHEFKRTKNGWLAPWVEKHADGKNVHALVGDWGKPKLYEEYTHTNDGTIRSNTVKITNELPHDFYNGRVRFLMAGGRYRTDGGEILAQYDFDNGSKTAVLVRVNIRKNDVTRVEIDIE